VKSQELIQIHALLCVVREQLETERTVPSDAFVKYDSQPVRPSHVHRPKQAHKNGVSQLLTGIECTLRSNPPPEAAPVLPVHGNS